MRSLSLAMLPASATIGLDGLDALIGALRERGYTVVGPRVALGAIVYDELCVRGRPAGGLESTSRTAAPSGSSAATTSALFAHAVGPDSLKHFLFPPRLRAWRARRGERRRRSRSRAPEAPPRYAFVGVRACDLHAVAIQDRVFLGGRHVEPDYAARRARRVLRRGQLRPRRRHLLLRLDGLRAAGARRLRPRADRAGRRARPPLRRRGWQRARRGAARRRCRAEPAEDPRRARGGGGRRARPPRRWAAAGHRRPARAAAGERRAPALGRGGASAA